MRLYCFSEDSLPGVNRDSVESLRILKTADCFFNAMDIPTHCKAAHCNCLSFFNLSTLHQRNCIVAQEIYIIWEISESLFTYPFSINGFLGYATLVNNLRKTHQAFLVKDLRLNRFLRLHRVCPLCFVDSKRSCQQKNDRNARFLISYKSGM